MLGKHLSPDARKKISKALSVNNKGGRAKWFIVAGQKVQGTWEKKVAQALESSNIKWEKITSKSYSFKYIKNDNSVHHYTPDFFL